MINKGVSTRPSLSGEVIREGGISFKCYFALKSVASDPTEIWSDNIGVYTRFITR